MPDYTIRDPATGRTVKLRGDSPPTEAELEDIFASMPGSTPMPSGATDQSLLAQSTVEGDPAPAQPVQRLAGIGIRTVPDAEWAGMSTGEKMRGGLQAAGNAIGGMLGMGEAGREAVNHPKTTLATAMAPGILSAAKKAPGIVSRGMGISRDRASQNLNAASQAAKGQPVNTDATVASGTRMRELKATGARMPRAADVLLRRVSDTSKGPLTFEEARDFYSNLSRLSANEFGNLNPTMQRQVGQMKQALHEALVESAETVGAGGQYQRGISEYAKAAKASQRWENAKPILVRRLAEIAGVGGALGAYNALTD